MRAHTTSPISVHVSHIMQIKHNNGLLYQKNWNMEANRLATSLSLYLFVVILFVSSCVAFSFSFMFLCFCLFPSLCGQCTLTKYTCNESCFTATRLVSVMLKRCAKSTRMYILRRSLWLKGYGITNSTFQNTCCYDCSNFGVHAFFCPYTVIRLTVCLPHVIPVQHFLCAAFLANRAVQLGVWSHCRSLGILNFSQMFSLLTTQCDI
jgi:hypothetical protein